MPSLTRPLIIAGLLSLSAGVMAQPPGPPPTGGPGAPGTPGRPAMHMPTTRTELQAQLETTFDRLDVNHDGKLSPEDRDAMRSETISRMFDRLDTNKDGMISKAEFAAGHEKGRGARGMMRGAAMHRMAGRDHPMPRMMLDQSKGPITKSDFVARGLAMFDKVDTNHDGTISPAERDAARGSWRDRRGPAAMPPPPPPGQ